MNIKNLIVLCSLFLICDSYKILAVFPMPFYSHFALAAKLTKELAKRGHEVTFVSPFPQKTQIKNLKEISVEDIIPIINGKYKLSPHNL